MLTDKLLLCQRGLGGNTEVPRGLLTLAGLPFESNNDSHNGRKAALACIGQGAELGFTPMFFLGR